MIPGGAVIEFLLARIAEDEQRTNQLIQTMWSTTQATDRILAECYAKREVVGWLEHLHTERLGGLAPLFCLQHLASVYSDHPDYREEWKPE